MSETRQTTVVVDTPTLPVTEKERKLIAKGDWYIVHLVYDKFCPRRYFRSMFRAENFVKHTKDPIYVYDRQQDHWRLA